MKTLIIINGTGFAGKDSFVKCCNAFIPVANISSIDCIKERARDFGYDGGKTPEDRLFLHELKMISTKYNDYSFRNVASRINETKEDIIFVHIREIEEINRYIQTYSDNYRVITLLIQQAKLKNVVLGNRADDEVANFEYDFIIDNDGDIEELKNNAGLFLAALGYERSINQ